MADFEKAFEQVQARWCAGLEALKEALEIASVHGFAIHDIAYALMHISKKAPIELKPIRELLTDFERTLDFYRISEGPRRRDNEIWIIEPRERARKYGHRYLDLPHAHSFPHELFRASSRYHEGEDLVYAIAPAQ